MINDNVMEIDLNKLKIYQELKNSFGATKEELDYFDNNFDLDNYLKDSVYSDLNKDRNLEFASNEILEQIQNELD